jgi:hypothetical protein
LRVVENEKEKLEVFLGIRLIREVHKEVAARDGMTSLGRQNVIEGELGRNVRRWAAALQNKRAVGLESLGGNLLGGRNGRSEEENLEEDLDQPLEVRQHRDRVGRWGDCPEYFKSNNIECSEFFF